MAKHAKDKLSAKMLNQITNYVIVGLVSIAVILGVMLVKQSLDKPSNSQQSTGNRADGLVQPNVAQATPQGENLTEEEKAVLFPPGPNATQDEHRKYRELIEQKAKEAAFVDVTNCKANPLVLKIKYGTAIVFKNNTGTPLTITFDKIHTVAVAANNQASSDLNFGPGPGIYGFGCNTTSHAIGMVLAY